MLSRPGAWIGLFVSVMFCAGSMAPANADLEAGLRAYNRSDFVRARSEFFQSAKQGQAEAQFYLGEIYEGGVGVAIDYAGAFTWYRLAAQQGHALAQRRLASLYSRGLGAEKDETKAFEWYLNGAGNGDVLAQLETGRRYIRGQGTAKDMVEAYKWLTIAASYGDPDARTERDRLLDGLSEAEKQRAQSLASDWEQRRESRNKTESP